MSGLTVGYLSIDDLVLELKSKNGTDEEKYYASTVCPILEKKHWLLVTLLISNAAAMEALPLLLDRLVPEYLAIIISVSLVLFFGEVIPQAICTGPDQIKIASRVSPMTKTLMWILYPIAYPIAKLLDYLLGEHHKSRFQNTDLKSLIELHTFNALEQINLLHSKEKEIPQKKKNIKDMYPIAEYPEVNIEMQNMHGKAMDDDYENYGLTEEQANLMISAIEMNKKNAIDVMIPIDKTFMINYDEVLDQIKLNLILEKGYSRIPVYANDNPNDIIGLVRMKQLIGMDINTRKSMHQLGIQIKKPLVIGPNINLLELLREFKKGKSHMAFITEQVEDLQNKLGLNRSNSISLNLGKKGPNIFNPSIKILGIVTLEDVIEKMINTEIYDEDDYEQMNPKTKNIGGSSKSKIFITIS